MEITRIVLAALLFLIRMDPRLKPERMPRLRGEESQAPLQQGYLWLSTFNMSNIGFIIEEPSGNFMVDAFSPSPASRDRVSIMASGKYRPDFHPLKNDKIQ